MFFEKSHRYGGKPKKSVFFTFFFFDQKNPKIYSFLPMRSTFWSFFGPKKMTLFMTSGQNKSQNEKIWNLENCQILKSLYSVSEREWSSSISQYYAYIDKII